jgi:putative transposase
MTRNISIQVDEWYHCYNRGVDKRVVFLDEIDYERFLSMLYLANDTSALNMRDIYKYKGSTFVERLNLTRQERLVDIGAYCLMPNHFHLLIKETREGGISLFMQKLATGYTMYFNACNDRTGALFGGRFKTKHVVDDRYFKRLINYIHANPIELVERGWKAGIILDPHACSEQIATYRYSSFTDYQKDRIESRILELDSVKDLYEGALTTSAKEVMEESLIFIQKEKPLYKG